MSGGGPDLMQLLQEPEYLPYLVAIFCRSAHEFLVGRLGYWFHHRLIAERDDGEDYITFQGLAASLLGLSGDQAITARFRPHCVQKQRPAEVESFLAE